MAPFLFDHKLQALDLQKSSHRTQKRTWEQDANKDSSGDEDETVVTSITSVMSPSPDAPEASSSLASSPIYLCNVVNFLLFPPLFWVGFLSLATQNNANVWLRVITLMERMWLSSFGWARCGLTDVRRARKTERTGVRGLGATHMGTTRGIHSEHLVGGGQDWIHN